MKKRRKFKRIRKLIGFALSITALVSLYIAYPQIERKAAAYFSGDEKILSIQAVDYNKSRVIAFGMDAVITHGDLNLYKEKLRRLYDTSELYGCPIVTAVSRTVSRLVGEGAAHLKQLPGLIEQAKDTIMAEN